MKKRLIMCLALMLMLPCCALGEIILDKTGGEYADFAFAPDAELLEIFIPQIYGCDSALVRFGEYTMLIDCPAMRWKQVDELLGKLGVSKLSYALNSHPDSDHIGGFHKVLKTVPADEFLMGFEADDPEGDTVSFKVYDFLRGAQIPMRRMTDGETVEFGGVSITAVQRTDEALPGVNNKSLMVMIQYGERRIFFSGDIQRATQLLLAEEGGSLDLDTDILKYPHHGYEPMQDAFLELLAPEMVVSTSGGNNAKGVVDLKKRGIPCHVAANSALRLATDGKVWTVEKFQ